MEVLNRIIEQLKEKKKTQRELCDYLGVSQQVFTNWKSGTNSSYLKYISQIATFLGISTGYLYGLDSSPEIYESNLSFEFSHREKQLLAMFHNLNDEQQTRIMSFVLDVSLE